MDIKIEPKNIYDAYSTPIVQQTSFWSIVKERLGMHSYAFEFSVKNRDIYTGVGGFSRTNADFITFFQYLNHEDYIAYVPYGPEIEPSEVNQGTFLEELSEVLSRISPSTASYCATISTGSRTGASARILMPTATGWDCPRKSFRR